MKKLYYGWLLVVLFQTARSQNVGIGTVTPDASAQLEVSSATKGILIPKLTLAQRNAIASPATGLLIFQVDVTPGFYWFNGAYWVNMATGLATASNGYSSAYGITVTIAGSAQGFADGTGTAAMFDFPYGVALDAAGNLYVADYYNHRIRKITAGGVVSTFAGSGTAGSADGAGATASFNQPAAVAVDAAGNVYVADYLNYKVRKITPQGVVTTLAGSGIPGSIDGPGTSARVGGLTGIAVDLSGNVYVADYSNHRIRKIVQLSNGTSVVSTFAGSGTRAFADGTGTAAAFAYPYDVAVDVNGNVYVGDNWNNRIRKITPAGVVTTLAGSGNAGAADGAGNVATFSGPRGVDVDQNGNVYVVDSDNNKIRKVAPDGTVSTLAGTGTSGYLDGIGSVATFYLPNGIAVDMLGNVYVADRNNQKIRKIIAY